MPARVAFALGSGTAGRSGVWLKGHCVAGRWRQRDSAEVAHEVFVSGELLGHEAQDVMATRLHDAAHAVAYERKVQETSRGGRYHNARSGRWRPSWDSRSSGPAPSDGPRHRSGPYAEIARASIHDSDARLGRILAAVERAGVWDRTAFFVLADHGLEDSNPDVAGDWAPPWRPPASLPG